MKERYFHPETLKRISKLDLRARHIVDGFLSGMHKSKHFGNSVEFRQHRQYVPGDDLRSVDWKVWAKQDRLYVKQYEVDTNLRLTLLLDVSRSMKFGNGTFSKYDYGCTAAVSLAYLALRQQDAVGCILFDKDAESILPSKMKQSHLYAVTQSMELGQIRLEGERQGTTRNAVPQQPMILEDALKDVKGVQPNMSDALREAAEAVRPNGLVVVISDFLVQRDGLFQGLQYLRARGHDVILFHILDAQELDFTFGGTTRFDGLEVPVQIPCDPRMLRQGYLSALNEYLEEMKQGCSKLQIDYTLFRTDMPLDAAVATYLSRRNNFIRKR